MKTIKLVVSAAIMASVGVGAAWAASHGAGEGDHKGRYARHMEKMLERVDSDGDGRVSRDESIAANEERFAKLDANSDGYIDADERANHRDEMRERFQQHREMRRDGEEE